MVDPYVLVPDVLEHFSRKLAELVPLRVNEMTKVASGAASWPVEIPAGHSAIVACFDQLIGVGGRVGRDLCLFDLVGLLKLGHSVASEGDQLVVFHVFILTQQLHDVRSLI